MEINILNKEGYFEVWVGTQMVMKSVELTDVAVYILENRELLTSNLKGEIKGNNHE